MTFATAANIKPPRKTRSGKELIYRHTLWVRLSHWINVICIALLLMSGMQIFNAHPMLHWGISGDENDPSILSIYAEDQLQGPPVGWLRIGRLAIRTTGFLGTFTDADGSVGERAFPWWITVPSYQSLADGRRWHFFFAWIFVLNGLCYMIYGFVARHFQHDLRPDGQDIRGIGRSILDHLTFVHPTGAAAKRYNVLQKLTYLAVVFVLLPLMIATGLTMSPGIDSAAHWLPDLFGGRQSARTIHFVTATLIVLFVFIHVLEVFLAGFFNEMRSIITGWFAVKPDRLPARREP